MKYDLTTFVPFADIDPSDISDLAPQSDPTLLFLASYIFQGGFGITRIDLEFAKNIARVGAENGDPLLQVRYGLMLANGMLQKKDPASGQRYIQKGIKVVMAMAQAGNPYAQTLLGSCYLYGYGVRGDTDEARKLWESSSAQGEPAALVSLGNLYLNGNGVPKDITMHLRYLKQSAAMGYAMAQEFLATYNSKKQEYIEAKIYAAQAARQGSDVGAYILGLTYEATQDSNRAFKWYLRAAHAGLTIAKEMVVEYCLKKNSASIDCSMATAFQMCTDLVQNPMFNKTQVNYYLTKVRTIKIPANRVDSEGNSRTNKTPLDDHWLLFSDGSMAREISLRPSAHRGKGGRKKPRP